MPNIDRDLQTTSRYEFETEKYQQQLKVRTGSYIDTNIFRRWNSLNLGGLGEKPGRRGAGGVKPPSILTSEINLGSQGSYWR